jgi:predicted alpha/beta hydrolase family esterase
MATGFLILHGVENHRPPEHWQFLLAAQLVEHGLEVRYPALPELDAPELERWLATLEQELAALGGEQRVVVCHSLACSDADPYNPTGAQSLYGDALGVPGTIVEGAGHITADTGYGPWPFATEWCLWTQPQTS